MPNSTNPFVTDITSPNATVNLLALHTSPIPTYAMIHGPHGFAISPQAHVFGNQSAQHFVQPANYFAQPRQLGQVGQSGLVDQSGQQSGQLSGQILLRLMFFNVMTLQDPATANQNICTSVSSHLNDSIFNLSNVFNLCIYPLVSVGDGYSIPITNSSHSILPTPHQPLHLNSILSTPNIVKNLIYVCQFVHDNHSTVEYDTFGFSVKDFLTIPHAFSTSHYTSYQRLGHLRSEVCVMFFLVIQFRVIKRNIPFFVMLLSLENM
ncbi:hypothetical protein Tco_0749790 [Tanacetum coccineum]|uniref:Uncharacterized protein n=1 Tax=Tanacetum coccineum TaxID=301880 RepID=A0ABQ4YZH6_9ASTR